MYSPTFCRLITRARAFLFVFAIFGFITLPTLRADTVVLKNGDRLTGTAVKLEGGKLTFKTAYADAIAIAWDQVANLKVDKPLVLPQDKGNLTVSSIERTDAGLVVTTASGNSTMDVSAVTVLRTPADQAAYEASLRPRWGHAWTVAANASLALAKGNSDTETFGAGFTAIRATRTDKTSLNFSSLYGRDNKADITSANTVGGGLRYDHNLNPKLFVFGSGDFLTNALQDLDFRSTLSGGFGWHALKSKNQALDLMGGVAWTHENYSAVATADTTTPASTNSFAALNFGEQYTWKMNASSVLTEQANFFPDMNNLGQIQFNVNSSFSTKIAKMFNWVTTFTDNYTSFPPAGTLNNDLTLTTGLGVTLNRK
jgi:putative salt-induced outer membrane protein YdiY